MDTTTGHQTAFPTPAANSTGNLIIRRAALFATIGSGIGYREAPESATAFTKEITILGQTIKLMPEVQFLPCI